MPRLTIRPLAWRDIDEQLLFMEEQADLEIAERFLINLMQSCEELARMPNGPLVRLQE
jgi:plasmid stabilization system protein ParE